MAGQPDLDLMSINTIRFLAVDAVEKAASGHPGLPMGAAPMAYVLWTRHLRHNPANPHWCGRDRFVLSAGHGSMLLYALLHLTGYDLTIDDLKAFRQWGGKTPGHPEHGRTAGVETTTGPLGQGLGNAVGMAMAERSLAARFNRPGLTLVDNHTYCLVSDGDLMEGLSHEAASLAGHLGLGKLICLYDDNGVSIEGPTSLAFSEDIARRFAAYNWHVATVADGNDTAAIDAAIISARQTADKPSLIIVRTHIGFGSPGKQDTAAAHGEPLGNEETLAAKKNLGWPPEPAFYIPEPVRDHLREALVRGREREGEWQAVFAAYRAAHPDLAAEWQAWQNGDLPPGWDSDLPAFPASEQWLATRAASGQVLGRLAAVLPNLIGGAADLAPSTKTYLAAGGDFTAAAPGPNIHFGVREHAMGAILNGLALYGGLRPFGATFLVFADYLRPALRLAALMRLKIIYVFTHDSIGLGEDGPTHQPVEHLASLRAIPGLTVIRPADANETTAAWRQAITAAGPVALILSRQNLPTLDRADLAPAGDLARGAYILREAPGGRPAIALIASGSEVQVALAAADQLAERGIAARVVSMPSWELWRAQPDQYRRTVLPPGLPRLTLEAAATFGWREHAGDGGVTLGLDTFGASAPYRLLMENFGFTAGQVAERASRLLANSR